MARRLFSKEAQHRQRQPTARNCTEAKTQHLDDTRLYKYMCMASLFAPSVGTCDILATLCNSLATRLNFAKSILSIKQQLYILKYSVGDCISCRHSLAANLCTGLVWLHGISPQQILALLNWDSFCTTQGCQNAAHNNSRNFQGQRCEHEAAAQSDLSHLHRAAEPAKRRAWPEAEPRW